MSHGTITVTLTARETSLLLANEWNDHRSWSDIARKIRAAQRDRSAGDGDPERATDVPADPEALNDSRAMWAEVALRAFTEETGLDIDGDGWDIAICDLVADLRHLADRHHVSWDAVLDRVDNHYSEETRS